MFSIDKTEQADFLFRETSTKIISISLSSYRSIEFNYDAAVIERNNFRCVMKIIVSCVFVRLGFSIVHCRRLFSTTNSHDTFLNSMDWKFICYLTYEDLLFVV